MATITVTVNFETLKGKVQNHLSVIGKRTNDQNGNTLWSKITAQSAEMVVIDDYLRSGVHKVVNVIKDMVPNVSVNTSNNTATISITSDRVETSFVSSTLSDNVNRYVQTHALAEYLQMTGTNFGQKYITEEISILADIKGILMYKKKPNKSSSTYSSVSGTKVKVNS